MGFFPFFRLDKTTERDTGGASVGNFDTNKLSAGDRSFDTNSSGGKFVGELLVAGSDFGEVDTAGSFECILSDAGTDVGTFHFDVNAKFGEGVFDDKGVLLDVAGVSGGLFFSQ